MKTATGLHTHANVRGVRGVELFKVLTAVEAQQGYFPPEATLLWQESDNAFAGPVATPGDDGCERVRVRDVREPAVIQPGDVIRLQEGKSLVSVLYRRGSKANTLFATERCNSLCLMCSQPPRDIDDDWRVDEMRQTLRLMDANEPNLGVSGGEPTLLGEGLATILRECRQFLPNTNLHVLTNGRLFKDEALAQMLVSAGGQQTLWAVPVYADVIGRHDAIVDAPGAFGQTLAGLYQLARLRARVEVRIVLHKMSVPRIRELASFIYRRLPFAEHVAFMGLEPMGFTKRNREQLWIDPLDYGAALAQAVAFLDVRGMNVSVFNLPLCALPRALWPFARQSISDWKNIMPPECGPCGVKEFCSGFFASAGPTWRSRGVRPIKVEELRHEVA